MIYFFEFSGFQWKQRDENGVVMPVEDPLKSRLERSKLFMVGQFGPLTWAKILSGIKSRHRSNGSLKISSSDVVRVCEDSLKEILKIGVKKVVENNKSAHPPSNKESVSVDGATNPEDEAVDGGETEPATFGFAKVKKMKGRKPGKSFGKKNTSREESITPVEKPRIKSFGTTVSMNAVRPIAPKLVVRPVLETVVEEDGIADVNEKAVDHHSVGFLKQTSKKLDLQLIAKKLNAGGFSDDEEAVRALIKACKKAIDAMESDEEQDTSKMDEFSEWLTALQTKQKELENGFSEFEFSE